MDFTKIIFPKKVISYSNRFLCYTSKVPTAYQRVSQPYPFFHISFFIFYFSYFIFYIFVRRNKIISWIKPRRGFKEVTYVDCIFSECRSVALINFLICWELKFYSEEIENLNLIAICYSSLIAKKHLWTYTYLHTRDRIYINIYRVEKGLKVHGQKGHQRLLKNK